MPEIQSQFEAIMPPGVPPLVLFRAIATSERAYKKFRNGSLLDRGPLTLREREIVIDRTCALTRCEYEWGVHVTIFAAAAKLTEEQVRATVLEPANAACWTETEQVLIAAVDALHHNAAWRGAEFENLKAHYSDDKILEIIQLCGFYRTVSYFANGLDLPLEPNTARFPQA
jgi:alkylhydroperoxidase family enzyme